MPKRKPRPKPRKLPPGVIGMAEWKEAKRVAACNAAAREFMKLPPEERRRQLMGMFEVRVEIGKKPGDEPPAEDFASE